MREEVGGACGGRGWRGGGGWSREEVCVVAGDDVWQVSGQVLGGEGTRFCVISMGICNSHVQ